MAIQNIQRYPNYTEGHKELSTQSQKHVRKFQACSVFLPVMLHVT